VSIVLRAYSYMRIWAERTLAPSDRRIPPVVAQP
jgi:hypothetical protein